MTKIYIYTFFFTIPFLLILCTAPNRPTFQTPSTDFSWRTPKTKPRNDSGEKFICCFCSFLLLAFFSRFICLSPVFNVCFRILYYIKDLKTNIKLFSRPFSFASRFSRRLTRWSVHWTPGRWVWVLDESFYSHSASSTSRSISGF